MVGFHYKYNDNSEEAYVLGIPCNCTFNTIIFFSFVSFFNCKLIRYCKTNRTFFPSKSAQL